MADAMTAVLGIDFSSHAIDLVKLDETTNAATWLRVELNGVSAFNRLRSLPAAMPPGSFYDDVYLAGIEQAYGRGQGRTQAVLQRVYGAVVISLPAALEVWQIHSTEWRKALGLPGNAPKEDCADSARALLGFTVDFSTTTGPLFAANGWPQDALDAYAIAYCARETNARAVGAPGKEAA